MVRSTPPTDGGTPAPGPAYPAHGGTTAAGADGAWPPPPTPSWTSPWRPPAETLVSMAPPVRRSSTEPLVLALVALGGVLAGAISGALLVMAVFVSSAEDIGREIAAEVAPEVAREAGDGAVEALGDLGLSMLEDGSMEDFGGGPAPTGPVEQHPAVEPVELGPDPVLNQYAQDCFGGTLQACDDLLYESAPLSEYERYGLTCGGRVKQYEVTACTDLE